MLHLPNSKTTKRQSPFIKHRKERITSTFVGLHSYDVTEAHWWVSLAYIVTFGTIDWDNTLVVCKIRSNLGYLSIRICLITIEDNKCLSTSLPIFFIDSTFFEKTNKWHQNVRVLCCVFFIPLWYSYLDITFVRVICWVWVVIWMLMKKWFTGVLYRQAIVDDINQIWQGKKRFH